MPRTLGIIQTTIWVDEDFRALSADAQRAYLMMLSQPKITNCGVLAYVPGKMSRLAADDSVGRLERSVGELEAGRFVVVDRETQELLVRTFVRHDKIEKQPKLRDAALREFREIESPEIRQVLRRENPELFGSVREPRPLGQATIEGLSEPLAQGVGEGVEQGVAEPLRVRAGAGRVAPAPSPTPAPSPEQEDLLLSAERSETTANGLPVENERLVIELLAEIGAAGDEGTPQVVRRYAAQLPEGALAKVLESVRQQRPRDKARYVVGALKAELEELAPKPRSAKLRDDPEAWVRQVGFTMPEDVFEEALVELLPEDADERIRLGDLASDLRREQVAG